MSQNSQAKFLLHLRNSIQNLFDSKNFDIRNIDTIRWNLELFPEQFCEVEDIESLTSVCCLYIDLILLFSDTFDNLHWKQQRILISTCFGVLSDIGSMKCIRNVFVENISTSILARIIDPSTKIVCGKELLRNFNNIVQNADKPVRASIANSSSRIYLYKLADMLGTCGDYEYQATVLEAIFRICSKSIIEEYAGEFFPEAHLLQVGLIRVNIIDFDKTLRVFLNTVNNIYANVFSIVVDSVCLDKLSISSPMNSTNQRQQLWVDFNKASRTIGIYCDRNSLTTTPASEDSEVVGWELITIFCDDVKKVKIFGPKDSNKKTATIFKFFIDKPFHVLYVSSEEATNSKVLSLMIYNKSDSDLLKTTILPTIFRKGFEPVSDTQSSTASSVTQSATVSILLAKPSTRKGEPKNSKSIPSESRSVKSLCEDLGQLIANTSTKLPSILNVDASENRCVLAETELCIPVVSKPLSSDPTVPEKLVGTTPSGRLELRDKSTLQIFRATKNYTSLKCKFTSRKGSVVNGEGSMLCTILENKKVVGSNSPTKIFRSSKGTTVYKNIKEHELNHFDSANKTKLNVNSQALIGIPQSSKQIKVSKINQNMKIHDVKFDKKTNVNDIDKENVSPEIIDFNNLLEANIVPTNSKNCDATSKTFVANSLTDLSSTHVQTGVHQPLKNKSVELENSTTTDNTSTNWDHWNKSAENICTSVENIITPRPQTVFRNYRSDTINPLGGILNQNMQNESSTCDIISIKDLFQKPSEIASSDYNVALRTVKLTPDEIPTEGIVGKVDISLKATDHKKETSVSELANITESREEFKLKLNKISMQENVQEPESQSEIRSHNTETHIKNAEVLMKELVIEKTKDQLLNVDQIPIPKIGNEETTKFEIEVMCCKNNSTARLENESNKKDTTLIDLVHNKADSALKEANNNKHLECSHQDDTIENISRNITEEDISNSSEEHIKDKSNVKKSTKKGDDNVEVFPNRNDVEKENSTTEVNISQTNSNVVKKDHIKITNGTVIDEFFKENSLNNEKSTYDANIKISKEDSTKPKPNAEKPVMSKARKKEEPKEYTNVNSTINNLGAQGEFFCNKNVLGVTFLKQMKINEMLRNLKEGFEMDKDNIQSKESNQLKAPSKRAKRKLYESSTSDFMNVEDDTGEERTYIKSNSSDSDAPRKIITEAMVHLPPKNILDINKKTACREAVNSQIPNNKRNSIDFKAIERIEIFPSDKPEEKLNPDVTTSVHRTQENKTTFFSTNQSEVDAYDRVIEHQPKNKISKRKYRERKKPNIATSTPVESTLKVKSKDIKKRPLPKNRGKNIDDGCVQRIEGTSLLFSDVIEGIFNEFEDNKFGLNNQRYKDVDLIARNATNIDCESCDSDMELFQLRKKFKSTKTRRKRTTRFSNLEKISSDSEAFVLDNNTTPKLETAIPQSKGMSSESRNLPELEIENTTKAASLSPVFIFSDSYESQVQKPCMTGEGLGFHVKRESYSISINDANTADETAPNKKRKSSGSSEILPPKRQKVNILQNIVLKSTEESCSIKESNNAPYGEVSSKKISGINGKYSKQIGESNSQLNKMALDKIFLGINEIVKLICNTIGRNLLPKTKEYRMLMALTALLEKYVEDSDTDPSVESL